MSAAKFLLARRPRPHFVPAAGAPALAFAFVLSVMLAGPAARICLVLVSLCALRSLRAAETWLTARTDHFEMFSSAPEAESKRILIALEQFRANFLASFPFRGASEPRTTLVLFRTAREFRPYRPLYEGRPKAVAGYFVPGQDEVMIAMTTDLGASETDPTEVIFHEYVHLLLHMRSARVPVWLNEGLAELYSTFRVEGKNVEFGLPKDNHVAVLQNSALMPLTRMLAVTQTSPDYNEESRAGPFYAQAWALTHFLVCGENRANAAKLGQFIEALGSSGETEASFRAAFGDFKVMEHSLRNYLQGGRYFKRTVPALLPGLDVRFSPAADHERECALLNLRWRIHQSGDTAYRALELVRQHPESARPHELLAAVAIREGDRENALGHWRQAIELKTDNPLPYIEIVRDALSGFEGAAFLDTRLPAPRISELRALARRALDLSPENADALEQGALIEALAEEYEIFTINRVQAKVLKMRDPSRTLLALGIIRWRAGDVKTAAEIVDAILSQRRSDMATRSAAQMLRSRLPQSEETDAGAVSTTLNVPAEMLAARAAVALQSGKAGTAAGALLDRLLVERGTTAPRHRLDPLVVRVVRGSPADDRAWAAVQNNRIRAAGGDAEAMFQVAVAHACGEGAEFSPTLAQEWLERAAHAGHTQASVAPTSGTDEANQFLRQRATPAAGATRPPLPGEIITRIDEVLPLAPRRPLTVEYRAMPRYPEERRRVGQPGEVLIHFRVLTNGEPRNLMIVESTDPSFADAVEQAVRQWRFIPAIRDRKPAATEVELRIRFEVSS